MSDKFILLDEDVYGEDTYRVYFTYGEKENFLYFYGTSDYDEHEDDNFEFYVSKGLDADFCEYIVKYFNNSYSSLLEGLKGLFRYTELKFDKEIFDDF